MSQPVIITVAITGALPRKKDSPAVPVTPAEQIDGDLDAVFGWLHDHIWAVVPFSIQVMAHNRFAGLQITFRF